MRFPKRTELETKKTQTQQFLKIERFWTQRQGYLVFHFLTKFQSPGPVGSVS